MQTLPGLSHRMIGAPVQKYIVDEIALNIPYLLVNINIVES
jgi:hypothetical protein